MARRDEVMPLSEFSDEMLWKIAEEVASPTPPSRWLDLGLAQISNRGWYEWHWRRGIDPDKRRPPIPAQVRAEVLERDGYMCGICGEPVEQRDVHLDHRFPYSLGGPTVASNLQVSHSLCNLKKGARC